MSIVEKAIQKLHQRAAPSKPRAEAAEPYPEPPAVATSRLPASPVHAGVALDRDRLRQLGMLPPHSEERRLAAEFRRIKRPLVERALAAVSEPGSNAGVIMVASAIPGEGKTFTAINLALSLALEKDTSVLLIDADVPKPQISSVFGLESSRGLIDAIINPALGVETLIYDTDVPNLSVLATGTRTETATELLASERMAELITQLRVADARRIIVFDSPPLLLTTESRELAHAAGQIVLVVRAGETPRQAVYDAIALLGENKALGVVLNYVDGRGDEAYYHGYGQYGTYGQRTEGHQ
jgi:protein-tyrosine kinase